MNTDLNKDAIGDAVKRVSDAKKFLHVEELEKELAKIEVLSSEPNFWNDTEKATAISKKAGNIKDVLLKYRCAHNVSEELQDAFAIMQDDEEFAEEAENLFKQLLKMLDELEVESWFSGEFDSEDAIVSINPGSGGKEALDWVEMLYRMYTRYADSKDWKIEIIDIVPGDGIGLDKVVFQVKGRNAFGMLKSENGVHRLVRISPTDEKKRRHTTFGAVEVLPVLPDDIEIEINPADVRVDVYRSSGPGGQSVNTTDSAVRLTHLPTGIVVTCQNEKSQIQNREAAFKVLRAKLYDIEQQKKQDQVEEIRGGKSANSFGSQIRNYVLYPYTLVKDLRSSVETGNVDSVLDGNLEEFVLGYHKWRVSNA